MKKFKVNNISSFSLGTNDLVSYISSSTHMFKLGQEEISPFYLSFPAVRRSRRSPKKFRSTWGTNSLRRNSGKTSNRKPFFNPTRSRWRRRAFPVPNFSHQQPKLHSNILLGQDTSNQLSKNGFWVVNRSLKYWNIETKVFITLNSTYNYY